MKFFKKNKLVILSFLIPLVSFLLISFACNFSFISKQNALISDLRAQYISLFSYLKDVFKGLDSLFYSFKKSMGGNMLGTFAYYLASPLNFIVLFFSKRSLPQAILLLMTLKISLSGLTMFLYLKTHYKESKTEMLIFSTSYALMGYVVNYFFNIMWLDVIYLTPLLLIGIDKIIRKENSLFYGIILFLIVFCNYYIGFMVCIYSCLYFIYQLLLVKYKKEENIKVILNFLISSLLAGLIVFVLFMPSIYELMVSNVRGSGLEIESYKFGKVFARTLIGANNAKSILNSDTVAIYLGIVNLILLFFYFINKKITKKERILSFVFFIILLIGIYIPFINKIWHGFSEPYFFNYRFSFLINLFVLPLCYKSFKEIYNIKLIYYYKLILLFLFMCSIVLFQNFIFLNYKFIYISIFLILIYLLILYNLKKDKKFKTILIILIISELFFNFYLSIKDYDFSYNVEYNGRLNRENKIISKYKSDSNGFYRIEKECFYTRLDSMLMDYNGISSFLSTLNNDLSNFYNNIGQVGRTNSLNYNAYSTPIMDSILGVKYILSKDLEYNVVEQIEVSKSIDNFYGVIMEDKFLYENPNVLSLGFMVNNDSKNFINYFKEELIINQFEVQNYILKTMLNETSNYLKPLKVIKENELNYIIKTNKDFYIYLDHLRPKNLNVKVHLNDELIKEINYNNYGIFKVKNETKLNNLKFVSNVEINNVFVYYMDIKKVNDALVNLAENQLIIKKQNKNYIKGGVNVTKDKTVLFTSIPYEKGWTILVDGKKINYYKLYDAFIGLDLDVGYHNLEFKFVPPLFNIGLFISIISLILFIFYNLFENKILSFILKFYLKYEEIIKYLSAGVLTTIVSITTYALFSKILNINYLISSGLSFICAVTFAFFTNKFYVFRSISKDIKKTFKELFNFVKYRLITLFIDLLLMLILVSILNIDDLIAKVFVQIIVAILNYIFSKLFVFKFK